MLIRKISISLLAITLFFLGGAASAGVVNGGGGQGVVCRNPDNSIRSVELLDLWEGRELYNRPLLSLGGNLAAQVDAALEVISKSYPTLLDGGDCKNQSCILNFLRATAKEFLEPNANVRRLRGVCLQKTEDAKEIAQPDSCGIEQIVNYQPGKGLRAINQDLFDKLDETNQAALIAHEAFYKFLRDWAGEKNSLRTRRVISSIFAGTNFKWPTPTRGKNQFECTAPPSNDEFGLSPMGTVIRIAADKKSIFFSTLAGTALIGEEAQTVASNGMEGFLTNDCGPNSPSSYTYSFDFSGPIEFDRTVTLKQSCEGGQRKHYLVMRSPGESEARSTALECKLED